MWENSCEVSNQIVNLLFERVVVCFYKILDNCTGLILSSWNDWVCSWTRKKSCVSLFKFPRVAWEWKTRVLYFLTVSYLNSRSNEFDEHDVKKKSSFNPSAINYLYCALSNDEFNRVSMCRSTYEIWKTLEVTHEGTNQVKEAKMSMLAHNKMDANESISDEKVANFCFMTHSDKEDEVMAQGNKEDEEDEVILESPSYDELFKAFEEMQLDSKKLGSKYVASKEI